MSVEVAPVSAQQGSEDSPQCVRSADRLEGGCEGAAVAQVVIWPPAPFAVRRTNWCKACVDSLDLDAVAVVVGGLFGADTVVSVEGLA